MILFYGRLDDPPLARTLAALQEAGAAYVLIEQSALDREGLRIDVGRHGVDGTLVVAGQTVGLMSIRSVYARPLELPQRAFGPEGAWRARLLHEQLFEWLDIADALVINRPRAMHANASKPLQAQLIGAAGFEVPETLVTSDAAEALAFWREHGRVVFKSASGVRSIVRDSTSAPSRGWRCSPPCQCSSRLTSLAWTCGSMSWVSAPLPWPSTARRSTIATPPGTVWKRGSHRPTSRSP